MRTLISQLTTNSFTPRTFPVGIRPTTGSSLAMELGFISNAYKRLICSILPQFMRSGMLSSRMDCRRGASSFWRSSGPRVWWTRHACKILPRTCLDAPTHDQPEEWQRRRWHVASLGGFRRPLVCVNLYVFTHIGPAGYNLQIMSEVGFFSLFWTRLVDNRRGFNMSADGVLSTEVVGASGATLFEAPGPHCVPIFWQVTRHGPLKERSLPWVILLPFTLTVRVCCLFLVCAHLREFWCSDRRPEFQTFSRVATVTRLAESSVTCRVPAETIWTRFHQLADDWIWAASKDLPAKTLATRGRGCTPKTVHRTLLPRTTQWNCTKLDPVFSVVVAPYRRIVELVRLLKQRLSREVYLPVWNAVVRMAHRVRLDLQDDLFFPITWDAELEPTADTHSVICRPLHTLSLMPWMSTPKSNVRPVLFLGALVLRAVHWWGKQLCK